MNYSLNRDAVKITLFIAGAVKIIGDFEVKTSDFPDREAPPETLRLSRVF